MPNNQKGDCTIHKGKGYGYIWLWIGKRAKQPTMVTRQSRSVKLKCNHVWYPVSLAGHGKWRSGCSKCGALSR